MGTRSPQFENPQLTILALNSMTRPDAAGGGQNRAVIVKSSGSSVVVAGYFKDTLQIGGFSRTANGGSDLFVLAIDKRYGTVSWVTSECSGTFGRTEICY